MRRLIRKERMQEQSAIGRAKQQIEKEKGARENYDSFGNKNAAEDAGRICRAEAFSLSGVAAVACCEE